MKLSIIIRHEFGNFFMRVQGKEGNNVHVVAVHLPCNGLHGLEKLIADAVQLLSCTFNSFNALIAAS